MSKAILVLDNMPVHCDQCPLWEDHDDWDEMVGRCIIENGARSRTYGRPAWCPLREMPEQRETVSIAKTMREAKLNYVTTANQAGYNVGWNDLIKVLNGDILARERKRYSDWEKEHDWSEWEDDDE